VTDKINEFVNYELIFTVKISSVNQPLKVYFSGVVIALSKMTVLNLMQF